MVKLLIAAGGMVDHAERKRGLASLHVAATKGHDAVIQTLVEATASLEQRSLDGYTPLHLAVKASQQRAVATLMEIKADIAAVNPNDGHTCLHDAAHGSLQHIAFELLVKHGADPNARSRLGHSPLHLILKNPNRDGSLKMAALLLKCNADLDAEDSSGVTALQYAMHNATVPGMDVLLMACGIEDHRYINRHKLQTRAVAN